MAYDDEHEYFLPLQDQQVFGAGIKRKRVPFIPSSDITAASNTPSSSKDISSASNTLLQQQQQQQQQQPNTSSIGDRYLSIVFPPAPETNGPETHPTTSTPSPSSTSAATTPSVTCEICQLPLSPSPSSHDTDTRHSSKPHETTLAHQVCLPHSHPPSAIDRTRPGFKYLSARGWDPDSRLGLGPQGQGISAPLKPRVKHDTLGLGVKPRKAGEEKAAKGNGKKVEKLNAKQVRKLEEDGKKKGERLREMFYAREDVQRYLGH
ncbi:hypothetical protein PAAG_02278 [Paracoccidioides lutzii Pb01]|uniref:G-patch domain-containing protein n=1 Tax=Paracoccidioides lutzii (strain ATCC MYA-826 / Pb01) TaxID=502779 RepID=C1GVK1_PARBA|nr:hypothetical protein PAAG_02278 [Paracoccidioides lutzii Pb01]EEH40223.1 hypothetical protein PAAG_02278 [Paracoccidioides lutzii Pb01]